MSTKVIMPQLGESVVEGTVTKWLCSVGENIKELDPLLEVNTDKVDTEIPSPASGVLLKIVIPEGTTVDAGTVLAWIGQPEEKVPEEGAAAPKEPAQTEPVQSQKSQVTVPSPGLNQLLGFISPVVARLAKEHGVDLAAVTGSGDGGRITKRDVLAYLDHQAHASAAPKQEIWETPADGDLFRPTELFSNVQPSSGSTLQEAAPQAPANKPQPSPLPANRGSGPSADGNLVPLTTLRKTIADRLTFSKHTSPHVTTVMEADLSKVVAHREKNKTAFEHDGVELTFTAYFISAIATALKAYPLVNSSWTDDGILIHRQINIGMAAALKNEGLIVPVIKGADELSLLGLGRTINDLAARARLHQLRPDEVKDGTFTLTNHGVSGSLFATPIINQPQCAILGAGAIQKRVVVINDAIAIRPMMYLTLTFDHRILDGASADNYLAKVVETLETWQ